MRTPTRVLAGVAVGCVLTAAATGAAHALWSADHQVVAPTITRGQVAFAASAAGAEPVLSVAGEPVTLTLPGTQIARALDEGTVFWTFTASGAALGAAGLTYDVSVGQQVADGETFDVVDGAARPGTVLAASTLKIYPAGVGADCSNVPATPAGDSPSNVFVYDGTSHVLQQPGAALPGQTSEQTWCAAVTFSIEPDGRYVNDVHATATVGDGSGVAATDSWDADVAFAPSTGLGEYRNKAWVEAVAQDATTSRDEDEWHAALQPDPTDEPGLTIRLDPSVTHANPAVVPGDHYTSPVS